MDTLESWTEQQSATLRPTSFGDSVAVPELLLTAEFKQRLDLVRHLAANSDRIPLVKGIHGVGKSTLLRLLLQQAPANWESYLINATPILQQDQLIHGLCGRFSTQQVKLEGVEQLVQRFADLKQLGRLPVIIVDDAERLPVTTLATLFGIYSKAFDQAGGPALVLFASPQVDDLLQETHLQFASQKLQALELLPMIRKQSDELVRHLFKVLGGQREASFSETGFERIFRVSGGLPGKINQQVREILQPESSAAATLVKKRGFARQLLADVSAPVLIGGGVLAFLLLLTLVYEDEINAVFESDGASSEEAGKETVEHRRTIPLTLPDQPLRVARDDSAGTEEEDAVTALTGAAGELSESRTKLELPSMPPRTERVDPSMAVTVDLPQLPPRRPVDQIGEQPKSEQQPTEPKSPPPTLTSNSGETAATAAASNPLEDQPTRVKPQVATGMKPKMTTSPNTPTVPELTAERQRRLPAPVTELGRTTKPDKKKVPEPVTLTRINTEPSPAPVQEDAIRREAWLLKQSPDSYTLQLIGVGDELTIAGFIRRHQLQGEVAYFRTKSNGRPWFPVLYGIYSSRSAAVAARSKLPGDLAGQDIWPRSLASVQKAIRVE